MPSKLREAATVILTSLKKNPDKALFNYDILSIKRSAKNSFMPGTYVFPGGAVHPADNSKGWLEIFSDFNIKVQSDLELNSTPPILRNSTGDLPKLTSLKLTAIRETFEETGILLCNVNKNKDSPENWTRSYHNSELSCWRQKVEKDAFEFLHLCQHFNCCPDIKGLHLWSNWLTPKNNKKRFDTVFFIAFLPRAPLTIADEKEIDESMWCTPQQLIEKNEDGVIILPPPQLYEISRLMNFHIIKDLLVFAEKRAKEGCERWMPEFFKAFDGTISILPGDDAYNIDSYDGFNVPASIIEMTKDEFHSKYKTLHRFEGKKIIIKNYLPKCGHILPVL